MNIVIEERENIDIHFKDRGKWINIDESDNGIIILDLKTGKTVNLDEVLK